MLVVDTNILIYAAHTGTPEHAPCAERLARLRRDPAPWHLTWSIAYEFLRVVTHPRVLTNPWSAASGSAFLDGLRASRGFSVLVATDRHMQTLRDSVPEIPGLRGNQLHDFHTAVLMREHGIRRICTHDTFFHRIPWVEVEDPMAGN